MKVGVVVALMSLCGMAIQVGAQWEYLLIDKSRVNRFGLVAADVSGDGYADIVSGSILYRNPQGTLATQWHKVVLPESSDVVAIVNVDGDSYGDIITVNCKGTYWMEALDGQGDQWRATKVIAQGACDHDISTQGYTSGQIDGVGAPEILYSTHPGIRCLRIGANPEESWEGIAISTANSEGIALADMDGDADMDVVGGDEDAKSVFWLENPGTFSANWTKHLVGSADVLDRIAAADMDGDGDIDIVVSEEGKGHLYLYRNNRTHGWEQLELATTNYGYLSMYVADMNGDGKQDIISGESVGDKKIQIWWNQGSLSFAAQQINGATTTQSHLGCLPVDLDNDGDLDIVSHQWAGGTALFVWRNDTPGGTAVNGLTILRPQQANFLEKSTAGVDLQGRRFFSVSNAGRNAPGAVIVNRRCSIHGCK